MTMRKGKDKMRENGNSPSSVETMAEDLYWARRVREDWELIG
jgi:hypothetical protein